MPAKKAAKAAADYHGMTGVPPRKRQAIDGLIGMLREVSGCNPERQVSVHGSYVRARPVGGGKPFDVWAIAEIDFWEPASDGSGHAGAGESLPACAPGCLEVVAACEQYLHAFFVKPFRPQGWEEDIDEKADAEWLLREVWGDPGEKPGQPAIQAVALPLQVHVEVSGGCVTETAVKDARGKEVQHTLDLLDHDGAEEAIE